MAAPVRLLILGTGGMAHKHAEEFGRDAGAQIVACVDMDPDRLAAFQTRFGIDTGFASLQDALDWGAFDAVANVTPDGVHHATTMQIIAAGKHVLCEKPLATNAAHAREMADAARAAGLVNMVNLSYRDAPALQEAARMVRAGAIGTVRHIEASYLQSWLVQPAWGHWDRESQWLWRLSTAHGSKGVLGDVGIHILDFATFAADQPVAEVTCQLATFDKAPGNRIGDYTLDANDSATMQVRLANGALGVITATRFATGHLNDLRLSVHGDQGALDVQWQGNTSRLRACLPPDLETATWRDIETPPVPTNYAKFIAAIQAGEACAPDFGRGADLQEILDRAEASAGGA
ncbi:Gfo/Idh/MocA family oxidoreductase [uncultured Tateyamaria sp.]|uniref:Gfo/Idh/MocA family protein n=1 Tax=uncultured Tateyamaria sp. TaxID=455651 RepID=UPI002607E3BC|nr:Gfo/Idh/MocA family oxidoreductase [uncultured Tateyamaria sp.]